MSKLYEELLNNAESSMYPMHMPGHKRNMEGYPLDDVLKLDITEIDGFDNLHNAEGIIKEAQVRAAKLYGSLNTHYLVNGSTCGVLASVSSLKGRGNTLIIGRNCHKSVYHAAYLNQFKLVYLYPQIDEEFDIFTTIFPKSVEEAVDYVNERGDTVAGVVITSPTYDGVVQDVRKIASYLHGKDIPLIVDEAHGAHFGFAEGFPESSIKCGADAVIHSLHKTCPSPTQTALLHVNGDIISDDTVRKYLRIYETSSPSYIMMAGIDSCIEIMSLEARDRLNKLLEYSSYIKSKTLDLKNIKICPYTEPGKMVISVKNADISGLELADILRSQYEIEIEMAAYSYVLCILTMMDTKDGIDRLLEAITKIDVTLNKAKESEDATAICINYIGDNKIAEDFYIAFDKGGRSLELDGAIGKIASDFVMVYPPGSPIIVPGEVINEKVVSLIKSYIHKKFDVQGIENNKIKVY